MNKKRKNPYHQQVDKVANTVLQTFSIFRKIVTKKRIIHVRCVTQQTTGCHFEYLTDMGAQFAHYVD